MGWPSQPSTEGLGHKPGSSMVVSVGNHGKAGGSRQLAGTFSSGCILGQGA